VGDLAEERARAADCADILKALGNPARLRIVKALCGGGETVTGLSARLGLPQAIVSQQLRILRMAGLAAGTREGGYARYALALPQLRELISCLEKCHAGPRGAARGRRKEDGNGRGR
jgi:DNA-binding transcriptional ArsR family regulator